MRRAAAPGGAGYVSLALASRSSSGPEALPAHTLTQQPLFFGGLRGYASLSKTDFGLDGRQNFNFYITLGLQHRFCFYSAALRPCSGSVAFNPGHESGSVSCSFTLAGPDPSSMTLTLLACGPGPESQHLTFL